MPNVSPDSILHPYLDLLIAANFTFMFKRVMEMIRGQRAIIDTILPTDIIRTFDATYGVHYSLAPDTVLALCNASEIWFTILLHAVNNVPYHAVATPLTIPTRQVHELGLSNPDDIAIGYYHNHAHQLAPAWYTDVSYLLEDLAEHLEGLHSGYAWMDERIQQSIALGFETTINWGVISQASWLEFLVCFYPERVDEIVEERGMTSNELLDYYHVDDSQALSTFVVPTNIVAPYHPYYPAFSPPSPVIPPAFDDDLDLPDSDSDISLADFSDLDDTSDTDNETDTSSSSDSDSWSGPDDPGFFFGRRWSNDDDDDDDNYSVISTMATTGYSEEVSIIKDDDRAREDEPWFTIVCYNDDGNEVGRKRLQFSELRMT
ncbi:hypothetical protein IW262DRAFT_1468289 [Armillaria fumosa]|nr:hypothetical protein IW262DRAFT_1468289 [Armillaria fumosa]